MASSIATTRNTSGDIMIYITEDCWDGYQQRGMKKKGDRTVPNCVKVEIAEGYCASCLIEAIKSCNENLEHITIVDGSMNEAEYHGRKVQLGKPFLTPGGPKKRSVYVKNAKGNVVKVNFGDPNMRIKKNIPARRKSFRARHKCSSATDRTSARYWSCKAW
jgi:hypothetical protein